MLRRLLHCGGNTLAGAERASLFPMRPPADPGAAGEELAEIPADPGMAAYKLVPPAQGHLFPEQDTRKPMRVELPNKPTSDRQPS